MYINGPDESGAQPSIIFKKQNKQTFQVIIMHAKVWELLTYSYKWIQISWVKFC